MTLRTGLIRGLGAVALVGGLLVACQGPDEYFRNGGSVNGEGGSGIETGGITGTGGVHETGGVTGTGGLRATGGVTGAAGRAATGGVTGAAGRAATGGVTGAAGRTATGGFTGAAGRTGTAGTTGAAGTRGGGGRTGTGGITGGAGRGAAGTSGRAGASGAAGADGTGPCAGLCDMPIEIKTASFTSGNVGTAAACYETTVSIMGGNCSNVPAPRTFTINGKAQSCASNFTLPAKVNGGYCFEFSAGTPEYSAFTTF